MSKFDAKRICRIGVLAALSFLLNMMEIKLPGNLHITFDSLPIIVGALLFGPVDGAAAAVIGEFFTQLLSSYGITATTVLWLIPPALRAVIVGLSARQLARRGQSLESRPVLCYGVCIFAAIVTTAVNTGAIWLDSVLMGYYSFAYVFGSALIRFTSSILTAVAITAAAMPLTQLLRRRVVRQKGEW